MTQQAEGRGQHRTVDAAPWYRFPWAELQTCRSQEGSSACPDVSQLRDGSGPEQNVKLSVAGPVWHEM